MTNDDKNDMLSLFTEKEGNVQLVVLKVIKYLIHAIQPLNCLKTEKK